MNQSKVPDSRGGPRGRLSGRSPPRIWRGVLRLVVLLAIAVLVYRASPASSRIGVTFVRGQPDRLDEVDTFYVSDEIGESKPSEVLSTLARSLSPGESVDIDFDSLELEDALLEHPELLEALGRDSSALEKPVDLTRTMLVSLADGKIVALDELTGDIVWTVETGSPLVMSSKDKSSSEGIFPSTDGALFTYRINEDGTAGSVERLPLKVKDLVDSSPSPTPEGNVVLGSQQTVVFIIDVEKGIVTKKISGDEKDLFMYLQGDGSAEKKKQETCEVGEEFHDVDADGTNAIGEGGGGRDASGKKANVSGKKKKNKEIAITRKTYVVRSIHPSLGEQWNVTWSKLDKLGIGPTFLEVYGHGQDQDLERDDLKLVLAPDFSLRRFSEETGELMWSVSFRVPPTMAYPAMGKAIDLLEATKKLLGWAASRGTMAGVAGDGEMGLVEGRKQRLEVTETLVVGEIDGNVFGLMAPYFKDKVDTEVDGVGEVGKVDEVGGGTDHEADRVVDHAGGLIEQRKSTALVPVSQVGVQVGKATGKACKDGNGMCRIPVGFYPLVGNSSETRLLFLPKCDKDDLLDECAPMDDGIGGMGLVDEAGLQTGAKTSAYVYLVVVSASTAITVFVSIAYFSRQAKNRLSGQQHAIELPNGNTKVGRLEITKSVLGYGSGGTVVFDGILDSRKVAVKRMLKQLVDLAQQEIEVLIDSDEHPNIVRCFAMEEDGEFLYLALERCDMSLNDAMEGFNDGQDGVSAGKEQETIDKSIDTFRIAREIALGVNAVHSRGIVHRDLKPHNVLLNSSGRAKLSDMGLSKKLVDNQASFETLGAGGSPGWQAPEQLIARTGGNARLTASVDIFSSGMLIFYCLSGGKHPYGKSFDRDGAIMKDVKDLTPIAQVPCALNLISAMLSKDAEKRPTSEEVLEHPMWWSAHQRLAFLTDFSDRVEVLNRSRHVAEYHELESLASWAVGGDGQWWDKLDPQLSANLLKLRKYDTRSLRDLLRVLRNKHVHYRELPKEVQDSVGELPGGFLRYFETRYPNLVMACFLFSVKTYSRESAFAKYFNAEKAKGLLKVCAPPVMTDDAQREAGVQAAKERVEAYEESMRAVLVEHAQQIIAARTPGVEGFEIDAVATPGSGLPRSGDDGNVPGATPDASCKFFSGLDLPRKPWMVACEFYMKTGTCKYGPECRYDHPPRQEVEVNELGLPLRPGEPLCNHFSKTLKCKFGVACRYHHPMPGSGSGTTPTGNSVSKKDRGSSAASWRRTEKDETASGRGPTERRAESTPTAPLRPPPGF